MKKQKKSLTEEQRHALNVEVDNFFTQTSVSHCQFNAVMAKVSEAIHSAHLGNLRNSVCAVGETSAGKTHILNQILKQYPRVDTPEATELPVVAVELSGGKSTLAGLYVRLLDALGASTKERKGRVDDQILSVKSRLKSAKTKLVIIDEFHHVHRQNSGNMEIANSLKDFLNEFGGPVLLLGNGTGLDLLNIDAQLRSRIPHVFELKPFSEDEEGFKEFCAFLGKWSVKIEALMGKPHFLDSPNFAHRILRASQGQPGHVWAILRAACKKAKGENEQELSIDHFKDSFSESCSNLLRSEGNPFALPLEEVQKMRVQPTSSWKQARKDSSDRTSKQAETDVQEILKRRR